MENKVKDIIAKMTLEQKASMTSGANLHQTKALKDLGINSIRLSDGPHGVRKTIDEENRANNKGSHPAVCFPTACATGSSWDEEVVYELGKTLGKQAKQASVNILLGPGANIKRSPLCGRNFEYFSEDPLLSSQLASAYIKGVQSEGVATSLKHFVANNQEYHRITSSSEVDERTLREIYLAAFETVVKEAKPKTVMCSYNRVNGIHVSQNRFLLTQVLREEWGYQGLVVSDWGAVHDRVKALKAGLDLTMPGEIETDNLITEAVNNKTLDEKLLNQTVERVLNLVNEVEIVDDEITCSFDDAHSIARKVENSSAVLLKNDNKVLPISDNEKVLFVGEFAKEPRYQGGGSSYVNSHRVVSALEAIKSIQAVEFALGFSTEEDADEELLKDAVEKAKNVNKVVIFAGLPESIESEGFDRTHMKLPENQNQLIKELCKVNGKVIVVLHNGSPVEMPWINQVQAILEMYLGGEAIGESTIDLLWGFVNPSGHLAESFPLRVEDNPSYLYYLGDNDRVEYREGIFVGYRNYVSTGAKVLFPFGHGLSYTDFEFSNLQVASKEFKSGDYLDVSVDVKNVGEVYGKALVQLYIEPKFSEIIRPKRELKAFRKVSLEPHETKSVNFKLNKRSFAYWDIFSHDWRLEAGKYLIEIGNNVSDICLSEAISVVGEPVRNRRDYSFLTVVSDLDKNEMGHEFLESVMPQVQAVIAKMGFVKKQNKAMDEENQKKRGLYSQPVSVLKRFLPNMTEQNWQDFFDRLNKAEN
jgi:beta-glucosidase